MIPYWQHVPPSSIITNHWFVGDPPGDCYCKFCGFTFKRMTSAAVGGVRWLWNGLGGLACPGPSPGDTPVIDLAARRGIRAMTKALP